jgi:hypothetical protein
MTAAMESSFASGAEVGKITIAHEPLCKKGGGKFRKLRERIRVLLSMGWIGVFERLLPFIFSCQLFRIADVYIVTKMHIAGLSEGKFFIIDLIYKLPHSSLTILY